MRVIEVREDNPWPKWTEATQVVEGMHKPVFVRPVLARRDDGEIAWPSVQIRIGGLRGSPGAKFNGHSLAAAKEKADRLRADAESLVGHSGTVPFKVQLRKTAVNTKLTPAEARRVAQAIDEARRRLANLSPAHTAGGSKPASRPHRPILLEALARLRCFEGIRRTLLSKCSGASCRRPRQLAPRSPTSWSREARRSVGLTGWKLRSQARWAAPGRTSRATMRAAGSTS